MTDLQALFGQIDIYLFDQVLRARIHCTVNYTIATIKLALANRLI